MRRNGYHPQRDEYQLGSAMIFSKVNQYAMGPVRMFAVTSSVMCPVGRDGDAMGEAGATTVRGERRR